MPHPQHFLDKFRDDVFQSLQQCCEKLLYDLSVSEEDIQQRENELLMQLNNLLRLSGWLMDTIDVHAVRQPDTLNIPDIDTIHKALSEMQEAAFKRQYDRSGI